MTKKEVIINRQRKGVKMSLWNTIKTLFTPQPVEVVAEEPLADDEQQFLDIMRRQNERADNDSDRCKRQKQGN